MRAIMKPESETGVALDTTQIGGIFESTQIVSKKCGVRRIIAASVGLSVYFLPNQTSCYSAFLKSAHPTLVYVLMRVSQFLDV